MKIFNKKIRILISLIIIFSLLMVTGMLVRNIHHPYFSNIKKPVLFIVDLPKELIRIFISGLETDTPMLPSSIKNHQVDFDFILDGFYYFKDRKIYHSKRDTLFTSLNDSSSIFYITNSEEYFYEKKGGSIFKKCLMQAKKTQCKDWATLIPHFHHEIHVDKEGFIYSAAYNPIDSVKTSVVSKKFAKILRSDGAPPYGFTSDLYRDDSILVISPEGKVVYDHSLTDIFSTNDMEAYIYAFGLETDPFHLNSVYPAKKDFGNIKKGDLLLSLRHMSMLMIYRPKIKKIIWYKIGPWSNQHSAKFDVDGNIYLFDNNLIETHYYRRRENGYINGRNRLLNFNIESKNIFEYEKCLPSKDVRTITGGKIKIKNNSLYVDYSNSATGMLCDLVTGEKTYLTPDHSSSGRVIDNSGFKFLQFSQ